MSSFGDYIRARRTDAGLSLRAAAAQLKISHVYFAEVERGVRGPFAEKHWKKLIEAIPGISRETLTITSQVSKPVYVDLRNASEACQNLALSFAKKLKAGTMTIAMWEGIREVLKDSIR